MGVHLQLTPTKLNPNMVGFRTLHPVRRLASPMATATPPQLHSEISLIRSKWYPQAYEDIVVDHWMLTLSDRLARDAIKAQHA